MQFRVGKNRRVDLRDKYSAYNESSGLTVTIIKFPVSCWNNHF